MGQPRCECVAGVRLQEQLPHDLRGRHLGRAGGISTATAATTARVSSYTSAQSASDLDVDQGDLDQLAAARQPSDREEIA